MRLGVCVNMLASPEDPVGAAYLPVLHRLGYDYVELPLAQVMDLPGDAFSALLETLGRLRLPCESCNNFFPASLRLTGERAAPMREIVSYLERSLSRASQMGAKKVIFGSSGAKNVPEGYPPEQAFRQVVEVLREAEPVAASFGITIGIEPLNRLESNLILNLAESSRLMDAVHLPHVKLMLDYYHFAMEKDSWETLRACLPEIIHVHLASPEGRTFPGPAEQEAVNWLWENGYRGGVSIEAYSTAPEEDLKQARLQFPAAPAGKRGA